MRFIIVLLYLGCIVLAEQDQSFEGLKLDEYKTSAQLERFKICFLSNVGCTDTEKKLKARSDKILKTKCTDCTKKEKETVALLTTRFAEFDSKTLKEIFKLYDPDFKYAKAYLKSLNEINAKEGFPKISDDFLIQFPDA